MKNSRSGNITKNIAAKFGPPLTKMLGNFTSKICKLRRKCCPHLISSLKEQLSAKLFKRNAKSALSAFALKYELI